MMKLIKAPLALALAAGIAAPVMVVDAAHAANTHSAGADAAPAVPTAPAPAVDGQGPLVYSAITPCRLLDTRQPSARSGALAAREERDFLVYDADLAAEQGGAVGGCGLPDDAKAVSINLTAVRPASAGYLTAWAFGGTRPLASNLNLIPNEVLSNEITVAINTDGSDPDLMIYAHVQTDLVADVVGYWTTAAAPELACVEVTTPMIPIAPNDIGTERSPSCPTDHLIVSGSCVSWHQDARLVTSRIEQDFYFCAYINVGQNTVNMETKARCCRVATP